MESLLQRIAVFAPALVAIVTACAAPSSPTAESLEGEPVVAHLDLGGVT